MAIEEKDVRNIVKDELKGEAKKDISEAIDQHQKEALKEAGAFTRILSKSPLLATFGVGAVTYGVLRGAEAAVRHFVGDKAEPQMQAALTGGRSRLAGC